MRLFAIAENCYVSGRYDTQDEYDATDTPVIIEHYGLFRNSKKAEQIVDKLNKEHEDKNAIEGFMDDAFEVIALEVK